MSVTVSPLSPVIGAEIGGVDLSQPMDRQIVEEISTTLMQHLVVFFRGQTLSPVAQAIFSGQFGRLCTAQRASFLVNEDAPGGIGTPSTTASGHRTSTTITPTASFGKCPSISAASKWTQAAIAFWDNHATMHYALADYWPEKRLMHRVTIETG